MPIITIHTAKAGQGATVTAVTLASLCAAAGQRTLLIDASTGDLPAVLGLATVQSLGLGRYLTDPHAPTVDTLAVPVIENLDLLRLGDPDAMPATLDTGLVTGGCDRYDTVIIDAGTRPVTGCDSSATMLLVTRPCYLALRRAADTPLRPCGVVLINEPGRALTATDIEAVLGRPIVATILYDLAISRAVDSGPSPPASRAYWPERCAISSRPLPPRPGDRHARIPSQRRNRNHHYRARVHAGAASPHTRQCLCPLDLG